MLVVIQHVLEQVMPQAWLLSWCNLGRAGVLLFFLISGFVVPFSLKGPRPIERFAISRATRLLPALWVSVGAMLLLMPPGREPGLLTVAANMTMLALPLGLDQLSSVYWTLSYELVFYLLAMALFLAGVLRNPRVVGLLLLVCAVSALDGKPGLINAGFLLAGLLLRLDLLERDPAARPWTMACLAALLASAALVGWYQPSGNPLLDGWPRIIASLLPVPLFLAALHWRPRPGRALTYLGAISYSVYLFQIPVLQVLDPLKHDTPALFAALALAATLLVAAVVYEVIEKPFMALGRRLNARPGLAGA